MKRPCRSVTPRNRRSCSRCWRMTTAKQRPMASHDWRLSMLVSQLQQQLVAADNSSAAKANDMSRRIDVSKA